MKIFSNLIKSDDEMVREIRKCDVLERGLEDESIESKLLNLDLISQRNHRMNKREISENEKCEKPKSRTKLTQIMILK